MKNSNFSTQDVKKICETKLGIEFRPGKEFNGWFFLDGKKTARITVPKGRKPIPKGTYRSMSTQLKLNRIKDFDDLLECPLTKEGYEKKLRQQQQ